MGGGHVHRGAVVTLALGGVGKARKEQHFLVLFRKLHGAGDALLVRRQAVKLIPFLEGCVLDVFEEAVRAIGVDVAAAASLETGLLGKRADDAEVVLFVKREDVVVLEEHGGLFGNAPCAREVLLEEVPFGLRLGELALEQQLHHLFGALIDDFLGEPPLFDCLDEVVVALECPGHLEVEPRLVGGDLIADGAPVGHKQAFKAPFAAGDVRHQPLILSAVGAVETVVGHHDGHGLRFLDGDLVLLEIYLTEGAFIDDAVAVHSRVLTGVAREVFERGPHALRLHAADERRRELAREQRILREILEVSAAQGVALVVGARAQKDGDVLLDALLAHGLPHFFCEGGIPRASDAGRRRESGRGDARMNSQHIRLSELFSQPARAVRHHDVGQFLARKAPAHEPEVPAVEKLCLLTERQPRDDLLRPFLDVVVHNFLLIIAS